MIVAKKLFGVSGLDEIFLMGSCQSADRSPSSESVIS